jgi:hypothetical protein
MTTFVPEQLTEADSVYVGGSWDPVSDVVTGGYWAAPSHGGLCRHPEPQAAVIGNHVHWNGDYYMWCAWAEYCPVPSCHPGDESDKAFTVGRERAWQERDWLDDWTVQ